MQQGNSSNHRFLETLDEEHVVLMLAAFLTEKELFLRAQRECDYCSGDKNLKEEFLSHFNKHVDEYFNDVFRSIDMEFAINQLNKELKWLLINVSLQAKKEQIKELVKDFKSLKPAYCPELPMILRQTFQDVHL